MGSRVRGSWGWHAWVLGSRGLGVWALASLVLGPWVLGSLTLGGVLVGCHRAETRSGLAGARGDAAQGFVPTRSADLFFTTGLDGYVEPCGCTTRPLGGLQRLASVVRRGAPHRGLVDAGSLFFPREPMSSTTRPQHRIKAALLARAYRQLGALAINVSEVDLAEGVEFLKELQDEGAVRLVSANVRPVGDGGPGVARSFLHEVGGIRIGVTGVATPERVAATKAKVAVLEFATALSVEVTQLRERGAEIVVVLANIHDVAARELVRAVPGIDVVVRAPGSRPDTRPEAPQRAADAIIVEAGSQGQYVGRLALRFGPRPPPRPIVFDDASLVDAKRREMAEKKLRAFRVELDAWRRDPAKDDAVKAKRAQIDRLEAEMARASSVPSSPPAGPHIEIELVPLDQSLPIDPQVSEMLRGYYGELKALNADKGDLAPCARVDDEAAVFVGSEACRSCHEEAYAFWKETKHASAWATLEDEGKHFDLTCIGCHTIGYRKRGGFCRLKDVGVLKDVGCESCHGPGSLHVKDEAFDSIGLKTTETTCAGECHVPEHSDAFSYEDYLRKITGPGHALSEE